jgi:hypothetical protein
MWHHADGDSTGAGPVAIGETVPTSPDSKWHPTVLTLLCILIIEVVAFAALRYVFGKL